MFFSAHPQYKSPLVVEEVTKGTQTSQWILHVWINTVFKVVELRTMGSRKGKKESKKAAVRTSPRKQTASTDADHDEDSQEPSQEAMDKPDRGWYCLKVRTTEDLREMERKQRKSVLSGQATKMSRSRLSLRNIPYSTICPIWSTRTRRREIICYWNWPGPCSRQVSLQFNNINSSMHHFITHSFHLVIFYDPQCVAQYGS